MKKLHNQHHAAGLEWVTFKKLPKILAGGIFVPLLLSIMVRMFPFERPAAELDKLYTSIDILSISLFFTVLSAVVTVAIGCIVVMLMKGPAYVADSYELDDADEPETEAEPESTIIRRNDK